MKVKIILIVIIILLCMAGGAKVYAMLTGRVAEAERLSAEAKAAWHDEMAAHAQTSETLLFQTARVETLEGETDAERAARLEVERELQEKVRVVGRLQARLANRPVVVEVVEASGPPAPPVVVECPDGVEVECPPCGPPTGVEIGGGADVQLVEIEGRQAAVADWFATVTGDGGWSASRGPERVSDVAYFVPPPDSRLPRATHWAAGVGLWHTSSSLFDDSIVGTIRRSRFNKGRRWGWWLALDASVSAGKVKTYIDYGRTGLGGYGVRVGLERRGGR